MFNVTNCIIGNQDRNNLIAMTVKILCSQVVEKKIQFL